LVHSQSSVVLDVLKTTSARGLKISVITTVGQPSNTGDSVRQFCDDLSIPCELIYDSAVPIYMPKVDAVFVGCEAVLSNGGIVNKVGTYSVALIAQHF
jgi:translation initiation factor eIF-2B subunit alpha